MELVNCRDKADGDVHRHGAPCDPEDEEANRKIVEGPDNAVLPDGEPRSVEKHWRERHRRDEWEGGRTTDNDQNGNGERAKLQRPHTADENRRGEVDEHEAGKRPYA